MSKSEDAPTVPDPAARASPAARWGRPVSWRLFALRMVHLNVGLMIYGLSIAFMLAAGVGLGPWDVFHEGLALRTPMTIGAAMVVAGLGLLLVSTLLGVRPGLGTVLNMALIGPWVDLFLSASWFPDPGGGAVGWVWMATGLALNGFATGLYITAGLGAGPRDGFAMALASRLRVQVRRARTMVEIVVFAAGWVLGGTAGLGTVAFALTIGPAMQTGLRVLRGLDGAYARASERARLRKKRAPVA
ncbi:MAG: hypothetical protein WD336_10125 [Trueperaceae bacterium]